MELPALPVLPAMVEAAGTTSATKVSLGQMVGFLPWPQLHNIICSWAKCRDTGRLKEGEWLPCVVLFSQKLLYIKTKLLANIVTMFSEGGVDRRPAPEIEESNYIEPEAESVRDREPQPRAQSPDPTPADNPERNQVVSTEQMCKQCSHDTASLNTVRKVQHY